MSEPQLPKRFIIDPPPFADREIMVNEVVWSGVDNERETIPLAFLPNLGTKSSLPEYDSPAISPIQRDSAVAEASRKLENPSPPYGRGESPAALREEVESIEDESFRRHSPRPTISKLNEARVAEGYGKMAGIGPAMRGEKPPNQLPPTAPAGSEVYGDHPVNPPKPTYPQYVPEEVAGKALSEPTPTPVTPPTASKAPEPPHTPEHHQTQSPSAPRLPPSPYRSASQQAPSQHAVTPPRIPTVEAEVPEQDISGFPAAEEVESEEPDTNPTFTDLSATGHPAYQRLLLDRLTGGRPSEFNPANVDYTNAVRTYWGDVSGNLAEIEQALQGLGVPVPSNYDREAIINSIASPSGERYNSAQASYEQEQREVRENRKNVSSDIHEELQEQLPAGAELQYGDLYDYVHVPNGDGRAIMLQIGPYEGMPLVADISFGREPANEFAATNFAENRPSLQRGTVDLMRKLEAVLDALAYRGVGISYSPAAVRPQEGLSEVQLERYRRGGERKKWQRAAFYEKFLSSKGWRPVEVTRGPSLWLPPIEEQKAMAGKRLTDEQLAELAKLFEESDMTDQLPARNGKAMSWLGSGTGGDLVAPPAQNASRPRRIISLLRSIAPSPFRLKRLPLTGTKALPEEPSKPPTGKLPGSFSYQSTSLHPPQLPSSPVKPVQAQSPKAPPAQEPKEEKLVEAPESPASTPPPVKEEAVAKPPLPRSREELQAELAQLQAQLAEREAAEQAASATPKQPTTQVKPEKKKPAPKRTTPPSDPFLAQLHEELQKRGEKAPVKEAGTVHTKIFEDLRSKDIPRRNAAFDQLVRNEYPKLIGIAKRYLGRNMEGAEEVVAATLAEYLENIIEGFVNKKKKKEITVDNYMELLRSKVAFLAKGYFKEGKEVAVDMSPGAEREGTGAKVAEASASGALNPQQMLIGQEEEEERREQEEQARLTHEEYLAARKPELERRNSAKEDILGKVRQMITGRDTEDIKLKQSILDQLALNLSDKIVDEQLHLTEKLGYGTARAQITNTKKTLMRLIKQVVEEGNYNLAPGEVEGMIGAPRKLRGERGAYGRDKNEG